MARKKLTETRTLDRTDRRILRVLQEDGRISYVDLADRIGLSTSPCLERVRRLEKMGFIRGYHARLDPALLGSNLLVYLELSLDYTSPDIFSQFRAALTRIPEIQEGHLVSGDFDFLLKIRVADMAEYRALLEQILHAVPGAVRDSRSLFVMEEGKETLALAIAD